MSNRTTALIIGVMLCGFVVLLLIGPWFVFGLWKYWDIVFTIINRGQK